MSWKQFAFDRKAAELHAGPDQLPAEYGANAVAPALHQLLLKAFLQASEPCSFKGGFLRAIFKKGSPMEAKSYRGILLANGFAKVQHSWSRGRLLPVMAQHRAAGQ